MDQGGAEIFIARHPTPGRRFLVEQMATLELLGESIISFTVCVHDRELILIRYLDCMGSSSYISRRYVMVYQSELYLSHSTMD